jgi:hypothetical protein
MEHENRANHLRLLLGWRWPPSAAVVPLRGQSIIGQAGEITR